MAMIQPWAGVAVLTAAVVVAVSVWLLRPATRTGGDAILAAATQRLRALPTFRLLARRELRLRLVQSASLCIALLGVALMVARPVAISDDSEEMRNRDVVLCMDVSGSMTAVVLDVMETYFSLVEELDGERIAMVLFDANAVTGFPLTDDYEQIQVRLEEIRQQLESGPIPGTQAPASGSSLVGDGLASCVHHFDRREEERSRTVVLASDNLLAGDAIYTLSQASDLAVDTGAMVYAVMPPGGEASARTEMREESGRTGGDVLVLDPEDDTNVVVIAEAVTKQEKKVILARAESRSFDVVWPGGLLASLGLALHLLAPRWVSTSRSSRSGRPASSGPAARSDA